MEWSFFRGRCPFFLLDHNDTCSRMQPYVLSHPHLPDEAERQARLEKIAQNRKKRQEAARKEVGYCSKTTNSTRQCFPDSSRPELDGAWTAEGTAAPSDFPNDSDNSSPTDAIAGLSAHNHHELQPLPGSSSDITAAAMKEETTLESVSEKKTQSRRPFQHVPNALLPCDPLMYWRLTTEEHTLITQLTVSYKVRGRPLLYRHSLK